MPNIRRNGNESTFRQNIGNSIAFQIPANKNTCNTCVDRRLCIYNTCGGGFAYNNTHARDRDKLFAHAHNT